MTLAEMNGLNVNAAKEAPIGATSAFVLTVVAICAVAFRLLLQPPTASTTRYIAAAFIVAAYLLFSPAVAGSLYSLLFETRKAFGLLGLGVAGLTLLTVLILADGLLLLPFWFLGILGGVKFVMWRKSRALRTTLR
jgi:hypothetical protein